MAHRAAVLGLVALLVIGAGDGKSAQKGSKPKVSTVTGLSTPTCVRNGASYSIRGRGLTGRTPQCATDCLGATVRPGSAAVPTCEIGGHPVGGRACQLRIRVAGRWHESTARTCPADLATGLQGPSKGSAGATLAPVRVDIRNRGKGASERYDVGIQLLRAGTRTVLGSEQGRALRSGSAHTHRFPRISVPPQLPAGDYELCARVEARADGNAGNDEACRRLVVAAEARKRKDSPTGLTAPATRKGTQTGLTAPAPRKSRSKKVVPPVAPAQTEISLEHTEADARATTTQREGSAAPTQQLSLMARKAQFDGLRTARSTAVISARALSDEFAYAISHRGDDCDETRPDVNPHATEICDRLDNDCDGEVDEGQTFFAYSDADGDGWGDPESALEVCPDDIRQAQEEGEWLILRGGDCDDTDPERWADCG